MLNLTSLRTFVAVVETGGIRSAGERLLRTPSAVSMSLKQLEEEVGGALFQGERKNELSELGRLVFEEARGLLSHHARTSAAIMAFATDRVGRCDLASVPSVAVTLLTETIAEVRRRGFSFDIHVRDIDSTAIIDAVENGAIVLRKLGKTARAGWAEAAQAIAAAGDETLLMGEFGNADDGELAW